VGDAVTAVRLTLGCAQIGNLGTAMSDETAHAILEAAWAGGIRRFDTAPHYGLGLSERRLGRFLATKPREQFVVSTKVGRLLVPVDAAESEEQDDEGFAVPRTHRRRWDFSADGIAASFDASRERLGLDRIDILYLHDPEEHVDEALTGGVRGLAALKNAGAVGEIGVGNKDVDLLEEMITRASFDRIMLAGRYTLLDQSADRSLLSACHRRGVTVDNAAVFNSGVLASSPIVDGARFEYAAAPPEIIARARKMDELLRVHGVTLPVAALAFARRPSVVGAVVVGAERPDQVESLLDRWRTDVSADAWLALEEAGLIGRPHR